MDLRSKDRPEFFRRGIVESHQAKQFNVFIDEEGHVKLKEILRSTGTS